jgi:hypothetical protein
MLFWYLLHVIAGLDTKDVRRTRSEIPAGSRRARMICARRARQQAVTSDPDDLRALDPTLRLVTIWIL